MITTQLGLQQYAGGGIELTLLERGGYRECDNALAPKSLQDREQLMEVMKVGERALALLDRPFSHTDAPDAKSGMVLRFMTHLQVDSRADKFAPSPSSELVIATRQPNHRTTVVARRAMTSSGVFLKLGRTVPYDRRDDVHEYLIKPLRDNILLASILHATADPIRQIEELRARVAQLEADKNAAASRTIFSLGGLSLSVQHRSKQ